MIFKKIHLCEMSNSTYLFYILILGNIGIDTTNLRTISIFFLDPDYKFLIEIQQIRIYR